MRRVRREIIAWRPVFWVTKPRDLKVSIQIEAEQGRDKLVEILKGRCPKYVDMGGLNSPSAWHEFVKAVMLAARSYVDWDDGDRIVVAAKYRSTDGETLRYASLTISLWAYDVTRFVGRAGGAWAIPYTYDTSDTVIMICPDLPERDPGDINI